MLSLTLLILSMTTPTPGYILTDFEAGYDQAAYDACVDSAEEVSCE
jgi:hypothetical protein